MTRLSTLLAATLLLPGFAMAQPSTYAGYGERQIKALSEADIEGLLQGKGMEMSLPAELNGHPGPRHVLDFGDELGLSPDQATALAAIQAAMQEQARGLGARIVDAEARLDRMFASGEATADRIEALSAEIGRLSGLLRAVHLVAHVGTRDLLTPEQIRRYDVLRGYAASDAAPAGHKGH